MKRTITILLLAHFGLFASFSVAHDTECIPKIGWIPLGKKPAGDAVAVDVLEGKTFSNKDDVGVSGIMPENGAIKITPGTSDQSVPVGFHNGSGTVKGDADLVTGNIKAGVNLFGINGKTEVVDTTSGDAVAGELLSGKKAWVDGSEITGSMTNVGPQNVTPGTSNVTITQGYHNGTGAVAGDADLVSGNIRADVTIFGVTGDSNVVDTSNGDATSSHIFTGKTAYVKGTSVIGSQGLFWGCRPGGSDWSLDYCLLDCTFAVIGSVTISPPLPDCFNFCEAIETIMASLGVASAYPVCDGAGGEYN